MTVRAGWLLPEGQTREDTRLAPIGTMAPEGTLTTRDGVLAGGAGLSATGTSAMQVQIGTGRAIVQGTSVQGAYPVAITAPVTLTVPDGHAQHPRIDAVVLRVIDTLYETALQDTVQLEIISGTPAASPTAPSTPTTGIKLWEIAVPAGTSAGTGGITWASALTDKRRYTSAHGGIIPRGYSLSFSGAYAGQYRDNGEELERWSGSGWEPVIKPIKWQPLTLPAGLFAPSHSPVQYAIHNGRVWLRGEIAKSVGHMTHGMDVLILPGTLPIPFWLHLPCGVASTGAPTGALVGRQTLTLNMTPTNATSWAVYLNGISWALP
ncbi:hypothetical protein [Streptomyces sp. 3211]|uniref:hypothetical protein n=1 Tax=Streptomyces sp. 3211 TaxID=1964449 RepID=UPI0009A5335E|nr:hypothetical protein [Streptomyces sp. 3211]